MFLRTKIHLIALLVLVLSIGAFGYHIHVLLQDEVGAHEKSLLKNQQQTLSDLLSFELDKMRSQIRHLAIQAVDGVPGPSPTNKSKDKSTTQEFTWLAELKRNKGSSWVIQSLRPVLNNDGKTSVPKNNSIFLEEINRLFPANQLSAGVMTIGRIDDAVDGGGLVVALPFELQVHGAEKPENRVFIAGIRDDALDHLMAFFNRQSLESLLISENGQIIFGRPYRATSKSALRSDIQALVSQKKVFGETNSPLSSGQSFSGVFRKLQGTNLYVLTSKASAVPKMMADVGLFGFLLLVCAIFSLLILLSELMRPYWAAANSLLQSMTDIAQGKVHAPIDANVPDFVARPIAHLKMIQNRLLEEPKSADQAAETAEPQVQTQIKFRDNSEHYKKRISEFVAPMTAIHGFARKGKITRGSPETKEIFESIVSESEALQKKLKQVLISEKVGGEGLAECNLIEIANSAISQTQSDLMAAGVVVRKDYNSVPTFEGMPIRLQAAIAECLRNCAAYAATAKKREVLVGLMSTGKAITLNFSDWGEHDPLKETDGEKITEPSLMSIVGTMQLHNGDVTVDYSQSGQRRLSLLIPMDDQSLELDSRVILSTGVHSMPRAKKASVDRHMPETPSDSDWDEEDSFAETEKMTVGELKNAFRKKSGES